MDSYLLATPFVGVPVGLDTGVGVGVVAATG